MSQEEIIHVASLMKLGFNAFYAGGRTLFRVEVDEQGVWLSFLWGADRLHVTPEKVRQWLSDEDEQIVPCGCP